MYLCAGPCHITEGRFDARQFPSSLLTVEDVEIKSYIMFLAALYTCKQTEPCIYFTT